MSKKLRLKIDALTVESFRTGEEMLAGRGTVRGRDSLNTNMPSASSCDPENCGCVPTAMTCDEQICYGHTASPDGVC